ncbi:hypothetical protein BKA67DRAFT_133915 [Truncatella angustata]|uniref:C2H2-type domain-containing protein n=1 Tax=Truncatella angustata TaxID=152316 RepID=A0A9P8RI74_9PEZI|nr:uncharacterized protein BKA67DRAFT_133915 [Truncatella angustata]KAH6643387.1 hypothetical protein BKA67DRAFT_133915 [Truncatella angustata]
MFNTCRLQLEDTNACGTRVITDIGRQQPISEAGPCSMASGLGLVVNTSDVMSCIDPAQLKKAEPITIESTSSDGESVGITLANTSGLSDDIRGTVTPEGYNTNVPGPVFTGNLLRLQRHRYHPESYGRISSVPKALCCPSCTKRYTRMSSLVRHRKKIHEVSNSSSKPMLKN